MRFKAHRVENFVKPLGNLAVSVFEQEFLKFCQEHINTDKPKQGTKYDLSLLKYLCNVLENSYDKKDKDVVSQKLDKKKIVMDVYCDLKTKMGFGFNDDDRQVISNMIEELHSSKQIKKTSLFKYLYHLLKKRLTK